MRSDYPAKQEIADVLERVAALLEAQDAKSGSGVGSPEEFAIS
jgi:hypothetical protein